MRSSWLLLLGATVVFGAQPDEWERTLARAIQLHQSGQVDEAIKEYETYLAVRPKNFIALSNLGAALARLGQFEDAIRQYQKALEIDPRNHGVRYNLALAYYKSAALEETARELKVVVEAQPENKNAILLMADSHLRLGNDKEVIALLSPRESQFRGDRAFDYLLGLALIRQNEIQRGQLLVDRILRQGDSAEAELMMGTTFTAANDFAGALKHFSRAVKLNPELAMVHSLYGMALLQTGNSEAAAAEFREELKRNPNDFDASLNLGALLRQDAAFEDALPHLKRALVLRPGSPGARYQLGALYLETDKLDEAREVLEELLKEAPGFLEAHVSLGTVYYRLGRKEDGDRERDIIRRIEAERQAKEPGAKPPAEPGK